MFCEVYISDSRSMWLKSPKCEDSISANRFYIGFMVEELEEFQNFISAKSLTHKLCFNLLIVVDSQACAYHCLRMSRLANHLTLTQPCWVIKIGHGCHVTPAMVPG